MPDKKTISEIYKEHMLKKQSRKSPFECPVCYTDGSDSGLVNPACKHKICITCYSTILLRQKKQSRCPCCRKQYLQEPEPESEQEPDFAEPPQIYRSSLIESFNNINTIFDEAIADLSQYPLTIIVQRPIQRYMD